MPGAEKLSPAELKAISEKSNGVLKTQSRDIQWVHSYVVEDHIYCVYNAANKELIQEHAECGGFPVNAVMEVSAVIDPTTGGL
jgi:hypothetical protein